MRVLGKYYYLSIEKCSIALEHLIGTFVCEIHIVNVASRNYGQFCISLSSDRIVHQIKEIIEQLIMIDPMTDQSKIR